MYLSPVRTTWMHPNLPRILHGVHVHVSRPYNSAATYIHIHVYVSRLYHIKLPRRPCCTGRAVLYTYVNGVGGLEGPQTEIQKHPSQKGVTSVELGRRIVEGRSASATRVRLHKFH